MTTRPTSTARMPHIETGKTGYAPVAYPIL